MRGGYIYILSNTRRTVLYVGVTNNLRERLLQHQKGIVDSFTSKYKLKYLVYYEKFSSIYEAISREKQLKNWHRSWKFNLIKSVNPELRDLSDDIPVSF